MFINRNYRLSPLTSRLISSGLAGVCALTLFLAIADCAQAADPKAGDNKMLEGMKFTQETTLGGIHVTTMTETAMRIDSHRIGFSIFAKAPDWTVYILRPDDKEWAAVPYAKWRDMHSKNLGATEECVMDKPLGKTPRKFREFGVSGYQYTFPGEELTPDLFQSNNKATSLTNIFVEAAPFIKATQAYEIQTAFYDCCKLDGLLIGVTGAIKGPGNQKCWMIRPVKFERVKFSPDIFTVPKGYKQKPASTQFMFKGISGALDEMGEMIDLGEPANKPKTKAKAKGKN